MASYLYMHTMFISRDSNIAIANDACQLTYQWRMMNYKKYLHIIHQIQQLTVFHYNQKSKLSL